MDTSSHDRATRVAALPLRAAGRPHRFFRGTLTTFEEVWRRRDLIGLLVRREVKARYKDSVLGLGWSLARPLAQLLIYYFALGEIIGLSRLIPSFAIFVFVGLTIWTLFAEIVSTGTKAIVSNSGLVKKIYLPREIFPLASTGSALFSFGVQFMILISATVVLGAFPLSVDLLYVPLAVLLVVTYALAIAIALSALNVYFRDLEHLVEVAVIVLFWASPIVYSYAFVDDQLGGTWFEDLYLANPMTLAVLGMQRGLWEAGHTQAGVANWPPDLAVRMLITLGISLVLLWLAQRLFSRLQGNLAQEL